jgi:DNA-binding HxlR family transcriptional regulator
LQAHFCYNQTVSKEGKMGRSNCATATALEIVGDRWSLVIIRDFIFVGRREFSDFMELREGISSNILVNRLKWLVESGIFIKHTHPANKKRHYYEITDKGFDLILVIMELARWGWAHIPGAYSPPQVKSLFKRDPKAFLREWKNRVRERSGEYVAEANAQRRMKRR